MRATIGSGIIGRMLTTVGRWSIVPLVAVLGCSACGTKRLAEQFRGIGEEATADGSVIHVRPGLTFGMREVAGSRRVGLLRAHGVQTDPFALTKDGRQVFRTFEVTLDNRSDNPIFFNPSDVTLRAGRDRRYPNGYTELYRWLKAVLSEDDFRDIAPLLAETETEVAPGKRGIWLLVFNRIDADEQRVAIDVTGVRIGTGIWPLTLKFARSEL